MINVVIADDDYNARTGLAEMIDWQSLDANLVAVVEDGEKVAELIDKCPNIDLLILDICMPHMDGLAVANLVRRRELRTEIILLSAHAEFEYAREALKYGVREYITKPISRTKLESLKETIKNVASQKQHSINWKLYLHGTELRDKIEGAIRSKDVTALKALINVERTFPNVSAKEYKEFCISFFGYMRECFKSSDKDSEIWKKHMEFSRNISDTEAIKKFLNDSIDSAFTVSGLEGSSSAASIVNLAKEYIRLNITSPDLHSQSVANHLNLSVDHISRLFKSMGDASLSDYIINAKIEKAKEIISGTTYSIRQVAQVLGYSDPNYFVRIFKKKTGVTPTEFRIGSKNNS